MHTYKMNNYKLEINNMIIELDATMMSKIHTYYEHQCTADYLRETYPKWSEQKIQQVAFEARELINDYGISEDEAIEEVLSRGNYKCRNRRFPKYK